MWASEKGDKIEKTNLQHSLVLKQREIESFAYIVTNCSMNYVSISGHPVFPINRTFTLIVCETHNWDDLHKRMNSSLSFYSALVILFSLCNVFSHLQKKSFKHFCSCNCNIFHSLSFSFYSFFCFSFTDLLIWSFLYLSHLPIFFTNASNQQIINTSLTC